VAASGFPPEGGFHAPRAVHEPLKMPLGLNEGSVTQPGTPPFCFTTLKNRADFKAASAGFRFSASGFTMLRKPGAGQPGQVRIGLTVTRKVGNAVVRNRIRRRLRAAIRAFSKRFEGPAMDLVVLARGALLQMPFEAIQADLARAIAVLSAKPEAGPGRKPA
jgi:ribonuclease P protein component